MAKKKGLFSGLADWYDSKRRESNKMLDRFITDNNHWGGYVFVATVRSCQDISQGFVDVLRVGEGVQKGGWRGYAEDGLRIVGVAPGIGRVAGKVSKLKPIQKILKPIKTSVVKPVVQKARTASAARVPNEPNMCTWVAGVRALRQTGSNCFASVVDLWKAAGRPSAVTTNLSTLVAPLRSLGAVVRNLGKPKTMQALEELVRNNPNGVVMCGISYVRNSTQGAKSVGHAFYAFLDKKKRFQIVDGLGKPVGSLDELAKLRKWDFIKRPGITSDAIFVQNAKLIPSWATRKAGDLLGMLCIQVRAVSSREK